MVTAAATLAGLGFVFWLILGAKTPRHVGRPSRAERSGAIWSRRTPASATGLAAASEAAWTLVSTLNGTAFLSTSTMPILCGVVFGLLGGTKTPREVLFAFVGFAATISAVGSLLHPTASQSCFIPSTGLSTAVLLCTVGSLVVGGLFSVATFGTRALRRIAGSSESRGFTRLATYPLMTSTLLATTAFIAAPGGISLLEFDSSSRTFWSLTTAAVIGTAVVWGGPLLVDVVAALVLTAQIAIVTAYPSDCAGDADLPLFAVVMIGSYLLLRLTLGVVRR